MGVTDQAFNRLTSYLSERTERFAVNGGLSDTFFLSEGCRKGLALAHFCSQYVPANYSRQRVDTCQACTLIYYADDSQLYLAVSPNVQGDDANAVKFMRDCIMDLRK